MSWRVAKSLEKLLSQINAAAPGRSKASDGGVGDAAHASRNSDHNPWVTDGRGVGVVTARDFTHDPADGMDCQALVDSLVASRDPRIKYIIWNRKIVNSSNWQWKAYTGANPHTHHAHVSVRDSPAMYDDEKPWAFSLPGADPAAPRVVVRPLLRRGDRGADVVQLQKLLNMKTVDGIFGKETEAAVKVFQVSQDLVADGVVGTYTWDALGV